jgi:hypothetical protein
VSHVWFVRSHAETTSRFLSEDKGIGLLFKIITSTYTQDTQSGTQAKRKVLFLLSYIVNEHAGDVVIRCDAYVLYPGVIDHLKSEELGAKENVLRIKFPSSCCDTQSIARTHGY